MRSKQKEFLEKMSETGRLSPRSLREIAYVPGATVCYLLDSVGIDLRLKTQKPTVCLTARRRVDLFP